MECYMSGGVGVGGGGAAGRQERTGDENEIH